MENSGCEVRLKAVQVTDLVLADDRVIFAETIEVLSGALESLSERAEPLGLRVSWIKIKFQAFGENV